MSPTKPIANSNTRTSPGFRFGSAAIACVMWGGWAWWVNRPAIDDLANAAWISAVTQGIGSFVATLVMVRIVTWLFHHVPRATQLILPPGITVLFTGSCLAALHQLAGTPDILRTITPAVSVAFFFNVFTAFQLRCVVDQQL